MLRLLRTVGVALILIATTGCAVRFVPAYDANVERDINDLHKRVTAFFKEIDGGAQANDFNRSAVKSFYSEATASADNLVVRASVRDSGQPCPTESIRGLLTGSDTVTVDAIFRTIGAIVPIVPVGPRPATPAPAGAATQVPCSAVNLVKIDTFLRETEADHRRTTRLSLIKQRMRTFNTLVRNALFVEAQLKSVTP